MILSTCWRTHTTLLKPCADIDSSFQQSPRVSVEDISIPVMRINYFRVVFHLVLSHLDYSFKTLLQFVAFVLCLFV